MQSAYLVAYAFALNFLSVQICKSDKQDKCSYKFNSPASNLLPHFLLKSQNFKFYPPFEAWAWMLFYNILSSCLTQKPLTPRNLTPKNPVNFKHASATFIATLFRTKKAKFTELFNNKNLKGYEILVVKFIQNLLIDLIKQLFDLFKRKGLFWALF